MAAQQQCFIYLRGITAQVVHKIVIFAINFSFDMPITVINKVSKIPGYDTQIGHLLGLCLLEPRLLPSDLISFIDYQQLFAGQIQRITSPCIFEKLLKNKLRIVMVTLREELGLSFLYIVKKCMFLHLFIHKSASRGFLTEEVSEQINSYLRQILEQDVPAVTRPVQPSEKEQKAKKTNSLSKLYNAIRSLSRSKKEEKLSRSKLKIEGTKEKGAIAQIAEKIITPFVCYLLKISQDTSSYSLVLSRRIPEELWQAYKWKLHNYLSHLGKIVVELNRLAKYYKEELLGTWVLLYYCMSNDIYVFYDLLTDELAVRSQKWKDKLFFFQKYSKINRKRHSVDLDELLGSPKLMELKAEIDMVMGLKQQLIYIYYNAALKNWAYLIRKPKNISQKADKMETVNWILDLYENYTQKVGKRIGSNVKKDNETDLSRRTTNSSFTNMVDHKNENSEKLHRPPRPAHHQKEKNEDFLPTAISLIPTDRNSTSTRSSTFLSTIITKKRAMGI